MMYLNEYKYKLIKKFEGKRYVYLTYHNENKKEILVTVDKKKNLYSATEVFYTHGGIPSKTRHWLSTIIEGVSELEMKKSVYDTVRGIFI